MVERKGFALLHGGVGNDEYGNFRLLLFKRTYLSEKISAYAPLRKRAYKVAKSQHLH